jgi:hypothetical protein
MRMLKLCAALSAITLPLAVADRKTAPSTSVFRE